LKIKTLKKLDLRFNKLTQFDPDFIEQIKLGLDVEYEGEMLLLGHFCSSKRLTGHKLELCYSINLSFSQLTKGWGGWVLTKLD
jgi:hypothetical protein